MKVTDIKCFPVDCFRTNWVFVKVYTDAGISCLAGNHGLNDGSGTGICIQRRISAETPAHAGARTGNERKGQL